MKEFGLIAVWLVLISSMAIEIIKGDYVLAIILAIALVIQTSVIIKALT